MAHEDLELYEGHKDSKDHLVSKVLLVVMALDVLNQEQRASRSQR